MQSIKVENADGSVTVWNGVLGLFIPFCLIVTVYLNITILSILILLSLNWIALQKRRTWQGNCKS